MKEKQEPIIGGIYTSGFMKSKEDYNPTEDEIYLLARIGQWSDKYTKSYIYTFIDFHGEDIQSGQITFSNLKMLIDTGTILLLAPTLTDFMLNYGTIPLLRIGKEKK